MPEPIAHLARRSLVYGLLFMLLVACSTTPVNQISGDTKAIQGMELSGSDATLIVDCLLPGVIKRLGSSMTYISPRRPVKASALECEIRGGEYVSYDRANYQTALAVWLSLAEEGDKIAQTYVAAIYEKGLGREPDYRKAAQWYERAANQGYAKAQFSLGYLYEHGLGVEKDPQRAFNLYSMASGLGEGSLVVSKIQSSGHELERLENARKEEQALLNKVAQDVGNKVNELTKIEGNLSRARTILARKKTQLASIQKSTEQSKLEQQRLNQTIAEKKRRITEIDKQISDKQSTLDSLNINFSSQKAQNKKREAEVMAQVDAMLKQKETISSSISLMSRMMVDLELDRQKSASSMEKDRIAAEIAKISKELEAKKATLATTELQIKTQRQIARRLGDELLALIKTVETRKKSLRADLVTLRLAQADIANQQRKIDSENLRLASNSGSEKSRLAEELKRQKAIINKLEQEKQDNSTKLAYLRRVQADKQVAMVAPVIRMIEPQLPNLRRVSEVSPVIQVSGDVEEFDVVGKVLSDKGILLTTINNRKFNLGANGVFKESVALADSNTQIEVVAIDEDGNRTQSRFVLAQKQPGMGQLRSANKQSGRKRGDIYKNEIKFGDYYALLIGNDNYRSFPILKTPIKDVEEVGEILKTKYGFKEITLLRNATRYNIITAFNRLRKQLTDKDNLLIYYAGHGELDKINMTGQWLPVDAEGENTANWISTSAITELVNSIPAKHVMVVADSCYSGIMTRTALTNIESGQSKDARLTWLKKMAVKRSRTVLTSGGVAPVLDEGGGNHSVFASAFLQVLRSNEKILAGQNLYSSVSALVALAADRYRVDQVPEYAPIRHAGHESGDFFLIPNS